MTIKINRLARNGSQKEITSRQGILPLTIQKDREVQGIGMGVLSDGTPYLNQRGLAALCGVQNAHIGTISSQWHDVDQKPRLQAVKNILGKIGPTKHAPHIELTHKSVIHFCYPADVCLAILEYYAFDAGANVSATARDNYRKLAGSKLQDMIYQQVGYDPSGADRFHKWHERLELNYQSAPKGFFHVFNEANTIIYELIIAGAESARNLSLIYRSAHIGRNTGKIADWQKNTTSDANILTGIQIAILRRRRTLTNPGATRSPRWAIFECGFKKST